MPTKSRYSGYQRYSNYKRSYYRKRFGNSFSTEIIIGTAIAMLIVVFFTQFLGLGLTGAVYVLFGILGLVLVGLFGVGIFILKRKQDRERALELSQVCKMTGIQFEEYLAGLLRFKGFTDVKVTPAQGDYGADLTGKSEGKKYAIQAKQYNSFKPVGVEAIYQVLGGQKHYDCDETMVITTGVFTPQAYVLSEKSGTVMIDKNILGDWISEYRRG